MPFPQWRDRLQGLTGQSVRYSTRSRSRTDFDRRQAMDFLQDTLQEAGQLVRSTRTGFVHSMFPGQSFPHPRTLEELVAYLNDFEQHTRAVEDLALLDDGTQDTPEDPDQGPTVGFEDDVEIEDFEPGGGEADAAADEQEEYSRPVCLRGFFVALGQTGDDMYANYEDFYVNITDPAHYALLTSNLGDQSPGTRLARAQLLYSYAFNHDLASFDEYDAYDADRAWLDASILNDGECAPSGTAAAEPQTGSGRLAVLDVPNALNPLYRRQQFRDPLLRRSFHAPDAMRVDHPGLRYDGLVTDYKDPWLRHFVHDNCCWMSSIIDLVNVRMNRTYLTYEKLWRLMGHAGAFDPIRAREGLSVTDMVPVFDHFDRAVEVFDGTNRRIYHRERTTRKYDNVRPRTWRFVITEHHVYAMDDERASSAASSVLRYRSRRLEEYESIVADHPYERISPFLPRYERSPPFLLKQLQDPKVNLKVVFLVDELAPDPGPDDATLKDILFAETYKDCSVHVVVEGSLMKNVVLQLVKKYRYRPSVRGTRAGITSVLVQSMSERGVITFVNPHGFSGDNRALLPDTVEGQTRRFASVEAYLTFVREQTALFHSLVQPEYCSVFHESTANVLHRLVRGGLFGWTAPYAQRANLDLDAQWCSLDVNRIYASTLNTDHLPTCTVFDRFEALEPHADPFLALQELNPEDLVLVFVYDTPTIYLDRGAGLCYQSNLMDFITRRGVNLVNHDVNLPMMQHPSGTTYLRPMAVLRTQPRRSKCWSSIVRIWEHPNLDRDMRKRALVRALGKLGTSSNTKHEETHLFCNAEEAVVFAEERGGKVMSIEEQVFLAFVEGDRVPRLEGHYLTHLYVLDTYRAVMQHWYDRLTARGIDVQYIRCDEFFFPADQAPLAAALAFPGDPESMEAFGLLKLGHDHVRLGDLGFLANQTDLLDQVLAPSSDHLEIFSGDVVCAGELGKEPEFVRPEPDEFHIENLDAYSRLLIQANVPGAGKSHAVLSRYGKHALVVCPTNALCVEFRSKYPGCTAMTLHRFLGVRTGEGEGMDPKDPQTSPEEEGRAPSRTLAPGRHQPEFNKVLLLDEIFMYSTHMLSRLYFRLAITTATKVFATGDPNQLPPVHEEASDELFAPTAAKTRRIQAVNFLFPRQMMLVVCKRGANLEDNRRMESIATRMRSPGFTMQHIMDLVQQEFQEIPFTKAMRMMRDDPYDHLAVCYYNRTCQRIAEAVLPGGTKLRPGVRLVNRLRRSAGKNTTLMVNYEYVVDSVQGEGKRQMAVLKDVGTEATGRYTVPAGFVEKHMHWSQTRTCHSLQGSSVSATLLIFNLNSLHMSPEFIYVALTRARNLKEVYFVKNDLIGPESVML